MALNRNFLVALTAVALTFVACPTSVQAKSFLQSGKVSASDAEASLASELSGAVSQARILELQDALRPTYAALPKNAAGHLGHQAARYVLHRLFVQRHGWFIKGLEPDGDVWHTKASTESLKEWVPSYLLSRLEERVGSRGIDLADLAALAAALEDLVKQEAVGRLTDVFAALGLPREGPMARKQVEDALNMYLVVYLVNGNFSWTNPEEALKRARTFSEGYTGWNEVEGWLRGVERSVLGSDGKEADFEAASRVAVDLGARYGTFNDGECLDLKKTLMDMQNTSRKPGRVRLSDFYKKGLYSHWGFTEKVDYLRAIGALDEADAGQLAVIVPNYLGARPNCLEATNLYAVCCRNECEDLMGSIERVIASPTAPVARIADLVATLSSPTVAARKQLPAEMRSRLYEIAAQHGGEVNIHGRLFAQWMHHAFPNECPYPHEAGTTSPLTPDEWIGADVSASAEERQRYVDSEAEAPVAEGPATLPWSHSEELLAGHNFLKSGQVSAFEAEASLASELDGKVSKARLLELQDALRPTYTALPKNEEGHLNHQSVRYILHRLFVQRHGWFIKGLEPDGDVWHTKSSADSLKEWVPSYLLSKLEERVGSRGIDLPDLAALAAALEDLVRQEAVGRLSDVYTVLGLDANSSAPKKEVQDALTTYLVVYLVNGNFSWSNPQEAASRTKRFADQYTGWAEVEGWLRGLERGHLPAAPEAKVDFATATKVAVDMGAQYGTFNDGECLDLKKTLVTMQNTSRKAGRVRLSDFYKMGLYSHWGFTEKIEYLRALGALDETDKEQLMVIVPNYIGARPNCLEATSLYAVCCRNECEDLMGALEREIAAPSATVQRIVEVVGKLASGTVEARGTVSPEMRRRLDEIASRHGGKVNVHGRLFAQWMHHAFPNECPYPHEAGTTSPLTPDEWIGADVSATEEERKQYLETCKDAPEAAGTTELPWSHTEELLTGHVPFPAVKHAPSAAGSGCRGLRLLPLLIAVALAAAAVHAAGGAHALRVQLVKRGIAWQLPILGLVACAAFALNLLDTTIFVCTIGGGTIAGIVSSVPSAAPREKCEKSMV